MKFKCNDFSSDLFQTALHEIGHILGLKHSTVAGTIMWSYLQNGLHTLHHDDIDSIQSLYGPKIKEAPRTTTKETTRNDEKDGNLLKIFMKFKKNI